ncbi:MAG: hypothetical protein VX507_03840 [Gemmatimonadota bacterium]|nr:hypothetical protein [Gemmatimonadota bacterium]
MTLHDSYARFTPYELAFPNLDHLEELILGVEEEAKNQGLDLSNLNTFFAMGHVDAFVREIQGPDALPETIYQYVTLVFHAVHFNQAGCPIYLLSENVARDLLENHPGGQPTPPQSSGYIQLPQHLLWMSGADSDTPESIDGVFWVLSNRGTLHSLLVAGLRPDRPGFVIVPVPEAPISEASNWVNAVVRNGMDDFSSQLPGGELDQLHALETSGEVLKLLARFFAYVSSMQGAVEKMSPSNKDQADPVPSILPFFRVTQNA